VKIKPFEVDAAALSDAAGAATNLFADAAKAMFRNVRELERRAADELIARGLDPKDFAAAVETELTDEGVRVKLTVLPPGTVRYVFQDGSVRYDAPSP
jgi:CelD/BcsL family acetyltransferase involved in cellulose biosynthesis